MKNKRGQFYILAAIVIILIVVSLSGVFIYAAATPEPETIENIASDLEKETPRIVDYGIYSRTDLNELLRNFTTSEFAPYFLQKTEIANIVFVYGNKEELYSVQYKEAVTGTISANIGSGANWEIIGDYAEITDLTVNPTDTYVEVEILDQNYRFDLRDNEMFYFLIVHEKEGERYVQRN